MALSYDPFYFVCQLDALRKYVLLLFYEPLLQILFVWDHVLC